MLQVVFRIRRDRAITRVSAAHPESRLVLWCNLQADVVEIQAPTAQEADRIGAALAKGHEGVRRMGHAPGAASRTMIFKCPTQRRKSVSLLVEQHGCLLVPPVVCQKGWDLFRIFVFDESELEPLFRRVRRLGEVEIVRKRRIESPLIEEQFLLSAAELLGDLTRKQSETLLLALQQGYYSVPRAATMQDIARRRGRPRTTLEEHLRKAEGKILTALAPFVALRLHGPSAAGVAPTDANRRGAAQLAPAWPRT